MNSDGLSNCAVRVKKEPNEVPLTENDCGMIDEKSDLKNFQLLPLLEENSTHALRKCEENHKNELDDEVEIVAECEEVKPNIDLLSVKKLEDDHSPNITDSDSCKNQNTIKMEPAAEVKEEIFGEAAEESNSNFHCELVGQNKKRKTMKKLKNKHNLKKHISGVDSVSTHTCDTCSKTFKGLTSLKNHIDSKHTFVTRTCDICRKSFSSKSNLKIHIKEVHDGVKHTCDVCAKKYSNRSALHKHINKVHNGVLHTCDVCGKKFAQKYYLKCHIASVHNDISHACDVCGKTFTCIASLKRHINAIHNGMKLACDIC